MIYAEDNERKEISSIFDGTSITEIDDTKFARDFNGFLIIIIVPISLFLIVLLALFAMLAIVITCTQVIIVCNLYRIILLWYIFYRHQQK